MTRVDSAAAALFILAAFTLAGAAQTVWFAAPQSRAFALPLDGGATLRGRRIFGSNKTLRGFVVMVPAAGFAFAALTSGTLVKRATSGFSSASMTIANATASPNAATVLTTTERRSSSRSRAPAACPTSDSAAMAKPSSA